MQVRLSAPERVTAFPDHDVGIETVGQLLEEASPLSVHACAYKGGCHRLLGCLLHIDRFSDDSPDGCSDIARCVLTRARQLDEPFAAPALSEHDTAGADIFPLRLHDALPICPSARRPARPR